MLPPMVSVPLPFSVMPEPAVPLKARAPSCAVPPAMLSSPATSPPSVTLLLVRVTPVPTMTAEACVLPSKVPLPTCSVPMSWECFQVQRYAVGCIDHGGIQHSIDRDSPVGRSRSVTGEDDVCPAVAQGSVERVIPVDRLDEQGAAIRLFQGSGDILEDAGKRYFRSAGKVELGTGPPPRWCRKGPSYLQCRPARRCRSRKHSS